jgi:hypothetical protein
LIKIIENKTTKHRLKSIEDLIYKEATHRLSKYLFKVDKLSFIQKLKTRVKITSIVDFFTDFGRHHTHEMPFLSNELISIGLPINKADTHLDKQLRIIRNICKAITTTEWKNEDNIFYVRKIYFSSTSWYILKHFPMQKQDN